MVDLCCVNGGSRAVAMVADELDLGGLAGLTSVAMFLISQTFHAWYIRRFWGINVGIYYIPYVECLSIHVYI